MRKLHCKCDSNSLTFNNVKKSNYLNTTYLTIIRNISLKFDDIDDGRNEKKRTTRGDKLD